MQLSGKLHAIFEVKQITERFQKRDFVVETIDNPTYPQLVILQLTGERCAVMDSFSLGQMVNVEFSVRGREWKSPRRVRAPLRVKLNIRAIWLEVPLIWSHNICNENEKRN